MSDYLIKHVKNIHNQIKEEKCDGFPFILKRISVKPQDFI